MDLEQDSFFGPFSLVPSMDMLSSGVESITTDMSSISSGLVSVFSFMQWTVGWALFPIDAALQSLTTLYGGPILSGIVPYVTRAIVILSLVLFFVSFKVVSSFVVYVLQEAYALIRPLLVKYIPSFELFELFVVTLFKTPGAVYEVTKMVVDTFLSGTSKTFGLGYQAADKIGQGAEAVAKKVIQVATVAATVAKDVPVFAKEVAKEIISPTKYTPAQIEASKRSIVAEFHSRKGTSTMIPPPLPTPPPASTMNVPPAAPVDSPSSIAENNTDNASDRPLSAQDAPTSPRKRVIPSSKRGKAASSKSTAQQLPESAYLDMTGMPSLL